VPHALRSRAAIAAGTFAPRRKNLRAAHSYITTNMTKFLLWVLLLVFCWPIALLALVVYPLVWLLLLPFRLVGIAVDGVLSLLRALLTLPALALGRRS
jgi:hypothetical protein